MYPQQSPSDVDVPVGEVPPTLVAVPPQARQVLRAAGLADAVDEGVLRARLEDIDQGLARTQRVVEEGRAAVHDLLRSLDADAEREACE